MSESEESPSPPPPAPPAPPSPSKEELRLAMKAFRKRLKLTVLDDESRMGYGPMSSGRRAGIVAITPPDQFPQAVWDELVKQGKLRRAGGTTYEIVGE